MQTIANTPQYTLAVELSKNRVYWTPKGFWDTNVDEKKLRGDWEIASRGSQECRKKILSPLQTLKLGWILYKGLSLV